MTIYHANKVAETNGLNFFNVTSTDTPGAVIGQIVYNPEITFRPKFAAYHANETVAFGYAPSLVEATQLFAGKEN